MNHLVHVVCLLAALLLRPAATCRADQPEPGVAVPQPQQADEEANAAREDEDPLGVLAAAKSPKANEHSRQSLLNERYDWKRRSLLVPISHRPTAIPRRMPMSNGCWTLQPDGRASPLRAAR
ncbi:MAG: hypothetical protein IT435_15145 [Phycisphaerales bacterium]|nr:hypothetical protein [Phycisphaerales bacterium]